MTAEAKYNELKAILREMGEVTVAYSGGVDSSFLLKTAHDELKDKALGVMADSPSLPRREFEKAREVARLIGARLMIIETREFENQDYLDNPVNRCFFCKSELFSRIEEIAGDKRFRNVIDGSNLDDEGDYRPGMKAKENHMVRSPLKEAGLTKAEIRELSRKLGLPTWDKDELACLSSRFPYGEKITIKKVRMVEEAENFLTDLGFRNVRARHSGTSVRIEVDPSQISMLLDPAVRVDIASKFRKIGYKQVSVDLEGYRRGSLNAAAGIHNRKENIDTTKIRILR